MGDVTVCQPSLIRVRIVVCVAAYLSKTALGG